ncbi:nitroreductase/quinone reductase family protein [Spirillospora sp. NPDC048911]|uniref:nitroreductase/quinone reductase family protein n=1 Tax=Spirillospora sp. NPDC048911 TaxID=3364527 RepID=UPI003719EC97
MPDGNVQIIEEFRANEGRAGGKFEGVPLLLLTSTGRRSGRRHTTPLAYRSDGDRLLVFASYAGSDADPAWFHNVVADPRVTIEIGADSFDATAIPLEGEERDRMYAAQSELVPAFADYQRRTTRVIPVVALYREGRGRERAQAVGDFLTNVHAELRADLASVRQDAAVYFEGGRKPELGEQLRTHCLTVCDALTGHHTNEDGAFPAVRARFPGLAPLLERLSREHVAVARTKDDLRKLVEEIGATDPGRFHAELDRMTGELEEHFAYEERELVAVLNTLTPADLGRPGSPAPSGS